jgi:hypothetical protein
MILVVKVLTTPLLLAYWYILWTLRPRPLGPFLLIAAVWLPTMFIDGRRALCVNFFACLAFVLAMRFMDDDRWRRFKRRISQFSSDLTETARLAFRRQVREAS